MVKPEGAGKSESASEKPNRGQDEKPRDFVNDATGETRTETQRWFRDEGRAAGFRPVDDDGDDAVAEPV
jgi:hypothetical protein